MATTHMFKAAAFKPTSGGRHQAFKTTCSAAGPDRRSVLLGIAGAAVALPLTAVQPPPAAAINTTQVIKANNLSFIQKKALETEVGSRAEAELRKVLTAADAPDALRLLLNDAGTGAVNGSVVLPEELSRPENKGLKPLVDRLAGAKAAVDAVNVPRGQAPLSWADTIVLAAKVSTARQWREQKIARAADPEKGAQQSDQFGTPIVVSIGRSDAAAPGPAGRVPAPGASPDAVRAFMVGLGAVEGKRAPIKDRQAFVLYTAAQPDPAAAEAALAADADFAAWKKKYDRSRRTLTRTDYEVDFVEYLNILSLIGTKADPARYLADQVIDVPSTKSGF